MPGSIEAEETVAVGEETFIECPSPKTHYSVVFEDNGETGYFYACDTSREHFIVDAMHIYNVGGVSDRHLPSTVQIGWSQDGFKAVLMINSYPHAVFDFLAHRGYCRNDFPAPSKEWGQYHDSHLWEDTAINLFS